MFGTHCEEDKEEENAHTILTRKERRRGKKREKNRGREGRKEGREERKRDCAYSR